MFLLDIYRSLRNLRSHRVIFFVNLMNYKILSMFSTLLLGSLFIPYTRYSTPNKYLSSFFEIKIRRFRLNYYSKSIYVWLSIQIKITDHNSESTVIFNKEDNRCFFRACETYPSEVTSNNAMRIVICHSSSWCKCGLNFFPDVNSTDAKKQVSSWNDLICHLTSCAQFHNSAKEEHYIINMVTIKC